MLHLAFFSVLLAAVGDGMALGTVHQFSSCYVAACCPASSGEEQHILFEEFKASTEEHLCGLDCIPPEQCPLLQAHANSTTEEVLLVCSQSRGGEVVAEGPVGLPVDLLVLGGAVVDRVAPAAPFQRLSRAGGQVAHHAGAPVEVLSS